MIAVARNISHGQAYAKYSTMKNSAVFIGADNMIANMDLVFFTEQLDHIWDEFKEAGRDYVRHGKEVTNDVIAIECSPTMKESENWSNEDWFRYAQELLQEIDSIQLFKSKRDNKTGEWITDEKGKRKRFSVPKTQLCNSKWMAIKHVDSESGIHHLHLTISRFNTEHKLNDVTDIAKRAAQAAENINNRHGWLKAMDIRQQHIDEINHVINDILSHMGEKIDWDYFKARIEDATFIDYKGRIQHYAIALHKDDVGEVDGYAVWRGNSKFTASDLGQKLSRIPAVTRAELKATVYDVLSRMDTPSFDWDTFVQMLSDKPVIDEVELRHDSKNNVVGYNVVVGNKKYNASQIGPQLTAKKIVKEWEKLHPQQQAAVRKENEGPYVFPFVKNIKATVFTDEDHAFLKVELNGQELAASILSHEHFAWYQNCKNKERVRQVLAMHYYGKEIKQAMTEDFKHRHYAAGKMPFGINVGNVYAYADNQGWKFWVHGEFQNPKGQLMKSPKVEISKDTFIRYRNADDAGKTSIVCQAVGDELTSRYHYQDLQEIKEAQFDELAPDNSVMGIAQSVAALEIFAGQLCDDFVENCGEVAIQYLEMLGGDGGQMVGGGGGGGNNDLPRKKDDEYMPRQNATYAPSAPTPQKGHKR